MVRVAGKINMAREKIAPTDSPDKLPAKTVLKNIRSKCLQILDDYYHAYHNTLIPELKENSIEKPNNWLSIFLGWRLTPTTQTTTPTCSSELSQEAH